MEMTGTGAPNMPKSYSLNMFKDFVPMCVFSETNQGKSHDFCLNYVILYICFSELFCSLFCIFMLQVHSSLERVGISWT